MCLAVYANGVGKGAGTHVSVLLRLLLSGCHDDNLKCRASLAIDIMHPPLDTLSVLSMVAIPTPND